MHLLILRQVLGEQKFLVRFLPISFLKLVIHHLSRTFFVNTCRQVNGIPIRSPQIYRTVERSCTHGSRETLVPDVRAAFILHSRNNSFPRKLFRVMNIRDCLVSRSSKFEWLKLRDTRIESRGSSRDCQLTFERYCTLLNHRLKKLTSLADSTRTWSYSLRATRNIIDVTFSKQWIHFLLSDRWPPTSTILKNKLKKI